MYKHNTVKPGHLCNKTTSLLRPQILVPRVVLAIRQVTLYYDIANTLFGGHYYQLSVAALYHHVSPLALMHPLCHDGCLCLV